MAVIAIMVVELLPLLPAEACGGESGTLGFGFGSNPPPVEFEEGAGGDGGVGGDGVGRVGCESGGGAFGGEFVEGGDAGSDGGGGLFIGGGGGELSDAGGEFPGGLGDGGGKLGGGEETSGGGGEGEIV